MKINNEAAKKLRKDFPIFENNPGLIYLDSASTTQKPKQVIEAEKKFYETTNANIHRGLYKLSEKATELYENSRKTIAKFINSSEKEVIFTRSATEALNLLAYTIHSIIPKGKDEIVLTEMEHHSNLVPWQQFAKRHGFKISFIKIKPDYTLDLKDAEQKITHKTAILSITHISNSLGTINPVKELIELAKSKGAITIIDAAQSVPHVKVDVKELGCDFLAFSGHKMLGPTGIGILYGKKELLEKLSPFNFGGDMISSVSYEDAKWNELPWKYEAGTQNIAGAIGLAEAIRYLEKIGMENVESWEKTLLDYALKKLKKIKGIKIYNSGVEKGSGTISFNISDIHPHDTASIFAEDNVCIRAGHHCNMPLMKKLGLTGTNRASFYFYNTFEDIDKLVESLNKVNKIFGK